MRDMAYINDCLKDMEGLSIAMVKKELEALPNILEDDENLIYVTRGSLINKGFIGRQFWLICVTSKRIIFLHKKIPFGLDRKDIPLYKLSSVEQNKKLVLGSIVFYADNSAIRFDDLASVSLDILLQAIDYALSEYRNAANYRNNSNHINNSLNQLDITQQLEKLAQLRNSDSISEEEFNIAKARLLE